MSLIRLTAAKELDEMRKELDKLFENFFAPVVTRRRGYIKPEAGVITPAIEMFEKDNDVVIRAELPGAHKEDVDISIINDALTIKGEYKRSEELKAENYYLSERAYGDFSRTIELPPDVDTDKVGATLKNGILEIVFAKKEEAKAKEKKITVS